MAAASTSPIFSPTTLDDYGFKYETSRTREKIIVEVGYEKWFVRRVKSIDHVRNRKIDWGKLCFRLRGLRVFARLKIGMKQVFASYDNKIRELVDEVLGWRVRDDDLEIKEDKENEIIRILYVDESNRKLLVASNGEVIENPMIYEYSCRGGCWEVMA